MADKTDPTSTTNPPVSAEGVKPATGVSGIAARLLELRDRRTDIRGKLSVSEEAKRRTLRDRSWIALMIVGVYVAGLLFLLGFLSVKFPTLTCTDAAMCKSAVADWKDMASVLLNVVAVAVLPIVTLVLGFYFGSESAEARASDDDRSGG